MFASKFFGTLFESNENALIADIDTDFCKNLGALSSECKNLAPKVVNYAIKVLLDGHKVCDRWACKNATIEAQLDTPAVLFFAHFSSSYTDSLPSLLAHSLPAVSMHYSHFFR